MSRLAVIDGAVSSPDEARVSVYDRGFLYGDSVFEVLRTYSGRPFAIEEHLTRLEGSARRVAIDLPVNRDALRKEVEDAIAEARNEESYVRIMVTRGSGPLSIDPDSAGRPLRVILVEPVRPPPREAYTNGIAAAIVQTRRTVDETAAVGAKVSNYLANLLAVREAKAKGAQEALIVDRAGHVVEGATSNVFVVCASRVATPPESDGILAGITRSHVIRVARLSGIDVDERRLTPADLCAADEVFITSSIRELLPVVRVDGSPIGAGSPGPVARTIHRLFRVSVGLGDRPMPWE